MVYTFLKLFVKEIVLLGEALDRDRIYVNATLSKETGCCLESHLLLIKENADSISVWVKLARTTTATSTGVYRLAVVDDGFKLLSGGRGYSGSHVVLSVIIHSFSI